MQDQDLAGEYYLQGVHEMASGFLLNPDNRFQFFFSYGALDRFGEGRWELIDNRVSFSSSKNESDGFELLHSVKGNNENIIVKVEEYNPLLKKYVYASPGKEKPDRWFPVNSEGFIEFPNQNLSEISLLLEFCPDRITTIPVEKGATEFLVRMNPGIMEVYFKQYYLSASDDQLTGRHPLLEGGEFVFKRN
jgi:hypothetical protein